MTFYLDWKVGDVINACMSVTAFCGSYGTQGLMTHDLNVSKDPDVCAIEPGSTSCPITIGNIGVTFKLVKMTSCSIPGTIMSDSSYTTYTDFGEFATDSNGRVGIQFTVTQQMLDDYIAASGSYRILSSITDSNGQNILRQNMCCPSVTIVPSEPPQPTHEIDFQLAHNPYLNYIQENIIEIGARLASSLQFAVPVQYVGSEMDVENSTLKVFVRHTALGGSLSPNPLSQQYLSKHENIYSLGILDDIRLYADLALAVITAIIAGFLIGVVIASGGWAAASIVSYVLIGASIFILGYFIIDAVTQVNELQETVRVYQAKDDIDAERDAIKDQLDNEFESRPYSKENCLTLLKGYQAADLTKLDKLTKELTEMQLEQIKQTYSDCTNALIAAFEASPGDVTDCAVARAGFTPCVNSMEADTNIEFNIKYPDPNIPKERGCEPECEVCIPLIEKCMPSTGNMLLLGLVGVVALGVVMSGRGGGGGTITVRSEK